MKAVKLPAASREKEWSGVYTRQCTSDELRTRIIKTFGKYDALLVVTRFASGASTQVKERGGISWRWSSRSWMFG